VRNSEQSWPTVRATNAPVCLTLGVVAGEIGFEHPPDAGSATREIDRAMSELAQRQHGVVARRQLLQLGMRRGAIARRLERGQLHEVLRGVYVFGPRRIGRRGRWMAAILAGGEGAVLSHRSAARLWALMPPGSGAIEVTHPTKRSIERKGVIGHQIELADDEWLVEDEIPTTSPFRTIFDLAAVVTKRELERAWHEAEVRGLRDRVSLPMLLERYPGHRGSRRLRALLEADEPVGFTRNDFEEAFVAFVDEYRLRRPRMNGTLALRGRFFEIDALWEDERVAVELDSRSVHGTNKNFESDKHRDRVLLAEGWRTVRVTWRQLKEEPDEVAADLRKALGQGAGWGERRLAL
jgi:very-short-patch-repair endonuclease